MGGFIWSGKRGSNPRPSPWQGDALSTELFPRSKRETKITVATLYCQRVKIKKMKALLYSRIKKWMIFALIGCAAYFVGYIWGQQNLKPPNKPTPPPTLVAPK